MKLSTFTNTADGSITVSATINPAFDTALANEIVYEIAKQIAAKYVDENWQEIVGKIDQQAVANLAVADAGKKIAEEIRTRPVVYRERTTKIYNSIF